VDEQLKLTKLQREAKSRLHRYLEEFSETKSLENITSTEMAHVCKVGHSTLKRWFDCSEAFELWFFDSTSFSTEVDALSEMAIERLHEIITSPIGTKRDDPVKAKDILAAIRLAAELADRFPKKAKEVIFADKQLAKLNESEVDNELKKLEGKL